jgi:hypothetical protein
VAGDRSEPSQGIRYCVSEDGQSWDAASTVTILADTMVTIRPSERPESNLKFTGLTKNLGQL